MLTLRPSTSLDSYSASACGLEGGCVGATSLVSSLRVFGMTSSRLLSLKRADVLTRKVRHWPRHSCLPSSCLNTRPKTNQPWPVFPCLYNSHVVVSKRDGRMRLGCLLGCSDRSKRGTKGRGRSQEGLRLHLKASPGLQGAATSY